jgi:hypothetical protein
MGLEGQIFFGYIFSVILVVVGVITLVVALFGRSLASTFAISPSGIVPVISGRYF